jgi:hypothetical protein
MRGSILLTFDELVDDLGIDYITITVAGQERYIRYIDSNTIYTTLVNTGDVVSISVYTDPSDSDKAISVIRRDYTTDDQGGDNGIRDTFITSGQGNSNPITVTFTATTTPDAYTFRYIIGSDSITLDGRNILLDLSCNELLLSTDQGNTFYPITRPTPSDIIVDADLSENVELLLAFTDTNVYRSTNVGQTWSTITSNLPVTVFTKGSCSQNGQILSVCGGVKNVDNGAYISFNSGNTFNLLSGSSINGSVIGRNYVTSNGFPMIFTYHDTSSSGEFTFLKICLSSGSTVQNITGGGQAFWYDAVMSDNTQYILASKSLSIDPFNFIDNQSVYLSSDSGTTFNLIPQLTGLTNTTCLMSDDGLNMMVTSQNSTGPSSIFVSNNYGVSWTEQLISGNGSIAGGDISSSGNVMAATNEKLLLNQNFGIGSFTLKPQICNNRFVIIGR